MSRWLDDLANVCRRTGFPVIEVDGWQRRGRSGNIPYEDGRPTHIMAHHTASPPSSDGWDDVNYCTFGADAAPLTNLYISRAPAIYVCAGGPTNTNGSGHDSWGGGVPEDSMNSHAIAIEGANNGVGEPWPEEQQRCYNALVIELRGAYGIPAGQVRAHFEWAPERKIDTAGPSRWAPTGSWDMDEFRGDTMTLPPPTPIPVEDDMAVKTILLDVRNNGVYIAGDCIKTWVNSGHTAAQLQFRVMEAMGKQPNYNHAPDPFPTGLAVTPGVAIDGYHYAIIQNADPEFFASFGPFVGPVPPGLDVYGR